MHRLRRDWARNPVDANGPGDVLDPLLAHVLEGEVEFVAHLVANGLRDADAAGLGEPFQAGRDVHPVAVDIVAVDDDVAEIDADAELDRVPRGTSALRSIMPR